MYAYDNFLQFSNPCEDMVAFLKACAPIAYTDYGKAVSHYGGLRIAPWQAIEYAGCGRAKQLAWDRAYDASGNLCYICYYDAGNSVYAGFMKSILTPEDRRELYNLQWRHESSRGTARRHFGAGTWNPHNGNSVPESLHHLGRV